jgi:nucleolar pre-ribosomal-associated protein 2
MMKMMQALLMSHRHRLGGRFDVVILALQSLMRCMFVPAGGPSTFGALALPGWLPRNHPATTSDDRDAKVERGIDAECVTHFTRLLTTICDPTAIRSSKNKDGAPLTDETKKAKRYAGQYMRYLLMELCECQLKGRMVEGGREALAQGVWSMMDVIGREGLDVMSEAMQGGGRSVLRGYWEEWRGVRGRGRR